MCVLALAWRAHPDWRLVVAANRDEFHDRPAAPLGRWAEGGIVAGRDLLAGGTWLGVAPGRFAAVTNLRGFPPLAAPAASRGALVADLLADRADVSDERLAGMNACNAVAIAGDHGSVLANRPAPSRRALAPGLHGLSNGPLDAPWPKTGRLMRAVEHWLTAAAAPAALLDVLRDAERPDAPIGDTGAIFVRDPRYGTRCSTVVTVDAAGRGTIAERRYDRDGRAAGDTVIPFAW